MWDGSELISLSVLNDNTNFKLNGYSFDHIGNGVYKVLVRLKKLGQGDMQLALYPAHSSSATAHIWMGCFQVEKGAFATSYIRTTDATVTRPATIYSRPTAGVLPANDFGVWGRAVKIGEANDASRWLFAHHTSSTNCFNILIGSEGTFSGQIRIIQALGSPIFSGAANTPSPGEPFEYQVIKSSTHGTGLRWKMFGQPWSAWILGTNAVDKGPLVTIRNYYDVGHRNTVNDSSSSVHFTMIVSDPDPKAALEAMAETYGL